MRLNSILAVLAAVILIGVPSVQADNKAKKVIQNTGEAIKAGGEKVKPVIKEGTEKTKEITQKSVKKTKENIKNADNPFQKDD